MSLLLDMCHHLTESSALDTLNLNQTLLFYSNYIERCYFERGYLNDCFLPKNNIQQ